MLQRFFHLDPLVPQRGREPPDLADATQEPLEQIDAVDSLIHEGTAAVQLPEEQRKREVVRHPDERTGLEKVARGIRLRAAVDEIVDQLARRPERSEDQDDDECDRYQPFAPMPVDHPVGDHGVDDLVETFHERDPKGPWVRDSPLVLPRSSGLDRSCGDRCSGGHPQTGRRALSGRERF